MKRSTTTTTSILAILVAIATPILAISISIATPIESKAITTNDIGVIAKKTEILPPELRGIVAVVSDVFYGNNAQNPTISSSLLKNVMTSFGAGGSSGLTLGGSSSGNQPLSISNLMDFAGLSQLDKIGIPKSIDGLTIGNTDSLLRTLTADYSAATASNSKIQVDESAKNMAEVANSISPVINTEEIDPESSLEMLRKMGQELQANGKMLQSSSAVQLAQTKIDANRYSLDAANAQQQNYRDFKEERYIDNAALVKARLQKRLLDRAFGTGSAPSENVATSTIANSSVFGP